MGPRYIIMVLLLLYNNKGHRYNFGREFDITGDPTQIKAFEQAFDAEWAAARAKGTEPYNVSFASLNEVHEIDVPDVAGNFVGSIGFAATAEDHRRFQEALTLAWRAERDRYERAVGAH